MNRAHREWAKLLAAGFVVNGTESATKQIQRIHSRGPLQSVVKGLGTSWFRKEFEAGHVVQVKMKNSQVEEALIFGKSN